MRSKEWNKSSRLEGGRVLNGGPQKDHQNKGEKGGQKNETGALTLEGGFLMEAHRKNNRKKVRREIRRVGTRASSPS